MLKDITTTCPSCKKETVLAIAVPDPGSEVESRGSRTSCRKCKAELLTVTQPDGTVHITVFDPGHPDQAPPAAESIVEAAFGLSEIVRIPYALWQPRGEIVGEFEHRPEWAEALRSALQRAQERPRPLGVPRRIFISYRWGDPEEDAWVENLCGELLARGNSVEFDKRTWREQHPPSVPELVARIAGCHVFLAVLDPGYVERVAADDSAVQVEGWVTDEFHTALAFARNGILTLLGLLRDGEKVPSVFRMFARGQAGNTFDVREDDSLLSILDRFFVQFGTAPDEESAGRAAEALHASRLAFEAGDAVGALDSAEEACQHVPDLADGFAQRARVAYRLGRPAGALADAQRALGIDPTLDEMLIYAAAAANDLEKWTEAARFARVALERNRNHANAHYLVGKALNELDQVDAALAHFAIARQSKLQLLSLYNDGGWAWRRAGDPLKGLEWYQEGLRLGPTDAALLANATAAAIEAGQAMEAYRLLKLLAEHHAQFPDIPFLASTLAQWCQQDVPPPVLSNRVSRPTPIATVACSVCGANIPLAEKNQLLCAGCGVVVPPSIDPCPCCDALGKALPGVLEHMGAGMACPFCGGLSMHYSSTT